MLPTEPPLSLHRLVAPVPPVRAQETATATHQVTTSAQAPAPKPPTAFERLLLAGQNEVGNAAVAGAVARAGPLAHTPPPSGPDALRQARHAAGSR